MKNLKRIAISLSSICFLYFAACFVAKAQIEHKVKDAGIIFSSDLPIITLNSVIVNNANIELSLTKATVKKISYNPFSDTVTLRDVDFYGDYYDLKGHLKGLKGKGVSEELSKSKDLSKRKILIINANGRILKGRDEIIVTNASYNEDLRVKSIEYNGVSASNIQVNGSTVSIDTVDIVKKENKSKVIDTKGAEDTDSLMSAKLKMIELRGQLSQFEHITVKNITGIANASNLSISYGNDIYNVSLEDLSVTRKGSLLKVSSVSFDYFYSNLHNVNLMSKGVSLILNKNTYTFDTLKSSIKFDIQPSTIQVFNSNIVLNEVLSINSSFKYNRSTKNIINTHFILNNMECSDLYGLVPNHLRRSFDDLIVSGNIGVTFIEGKSLISNNCRFSGKEIIPNTTRFSGYSYRKTFTPLMFVSNYIQKSLMVNEDGRFYSHGGVDIKAAERAVREYLKEGSLRGASTITMQLAKNLWLYKDKTIERKVEEALLSLYLESKLSKDLILELYVNVIEFGPGIYGIYNAAKYYFDKAPIDLSLKESLFLTHILPQPKVNYFVEGLLNESTNKKLNYLLLTMKNRGLISDEEYSQSVYESIIKRK